MREIALAGGAVPECDEKEVSGRITYLSLEILLAFPTARFEHVHTNFYIHIHIHKHIHQYIHTNIYTYMYTYIVILLRRAL
jgi:hypothetical protein